MSVILYEEEKFLRVAKTLKLQGRDIAHIWEYPKDWDKYNGMDKHIVWFTDELCRANTECYNIQYREDNKPHELDFEKGVFPYHQLELIKSLRGIHYNLFTNAGREVSINECSDKLFRLIYYLMSKVIDTIPEYSKVQTW